MKGGVASGTNDKNEVFVREDGPGYVNIEGLNQLERHPVRIALVQLHTGGAHYHHKLILEHPIEPNYFRIIVIFERKGALDAIVGKYIDKFDTRLSALYRQDSGAPRGEFNGGNWPPSGDGDLKAVFFLQTLNPYVREAVLDAKHLKVTLVKEGALHLVQRVEIDW